MEALLQRSREWSLCRRRQLFLQQDLYLPSLTRPLKMRLGLLPTSSTTLNTVHISHHSSLTQNRPSILQPRVSEMLWYRYPCRAFVVFSLKRITNFPEDPFSEAPFSFFCEDFSFLVLIENCSSFSLQHTQTVVNVLIQFWHYNILVWETYPNSTILNKCPFFLRNVHFVFYADLVAFFFPISCVCLLCIWIS